MQNETMNHSDPHPPNEATIVAEAFGTTAIPSRLPHVWFDRARSDHPEHVVLYCARCGQISTVQPNNITSLLQLVAVPPNMPDAEVPTGHDIVLPAFEPAAQYVRAENTCPTCMASVDELAIMHLTIDTPDDTLVDDADDDADEDTADAPVAEIVG